LFGDILLVRRQGIYERLIDWATTSDCSHVAIEGDGHLIEAAYRRVEHAPLNKYAGQCDLAQVLGASRQQRFAAVAWLESRIGTPYGWSDIWLDFERLGLHLNVGQRWLRMSHFDCSCLAAAAYATAGRPITFVPVPSPADLDYSAMLVGPRSWAPTLAEASGGHYA